jgi:uncharacterized protein (DUF433 family)
MASETAIEYAHIVRTPGVLGGEPRLDDTRIRVRDIVAARDIGGLSPEEIAAIAYPDLALGQIYAALAYYEDHRAEIDAAAQAESGRVERFLQDHPELAHDFRGAVHRE